MGACQLLAKNNGFAGSFLGHVRLTGADHGLSLKALSSTASRKLNTWFRTKARTGARSG
jgi:hypothetical protein